MNPLVVASISWQVSTMSAGASHSMEQAMARAMSRDTEQEQSLRQCLRYHGASSHMRSHTLISVCSLVALHSYIHSFIDIHSHSARYSAVAHQQPVLGCHISYSLYIIVILLAYSVTIEYCSALYCPHTTYVP